LPVRSRTSDALLLSWEFEIAFERVDVTVVGVEGGVVVVERVLEFGLAVFAGKDRAVKCVFAGVPPASSEDLSAKSTSWPCSL
jgi:hypothetical protein